MNTLERALGVWIEQGRNQIGQISVAHETGGGYSLSHRDDAGRTDLRGRHGAEEALSIARLDDAGRYRPLKTAPNLAHGWLLHVADLTELRLAVDHFYPARLDWFYLFECGKFAATPMRETLARQTGMYRLSAKISDDQADALVTRFCRSEGGCLRTIRWSRDRAGTAASQQLPATKYDPEHDQTGCGQPIIPLLCQEICALLVAETRNVVKESTPLMP